jgi:hypothetical protein
MTHAEGCPMHDQTIKLVDKHETTLFGCDEDGGLVTTVKLIKDTTDTIKKALYGLITIICLTVLGAILKGVITGG